MTRDFSAMTRRRSAGILGVFQALTTKSEPKKTSQIVQIIFEQCLISASLPPPPKAAPPSWREAMGGSLHEGAVA